MEVWHTGEGAAGSAKEKVMASNCRHVMPSGKNVTGMPSRAGTFCYFHSRLHLAAQKSASAMDSIEIPVLEDRCAIQVTITQVLRAIVNNTIDRPRASLLLYGLQLALQSVDRSSWAIPIGTVEALSQTSDGDELAAEPDDEDEDEEDEDDEEEEDSDSDESGDDSDDKDDESSDDDSEEENDEDDEDDDDGLDDETPGGHQATDELIADQKYLESVSNALDVGDMRLAARLLKESSP